MRISTGINLSYPVYDGGKVGHHKDYALIAVNSLGSHSHKVFASHRIAYGLESQADVDIQIVAWYWPKLLHYYYSFFLTLI